MLSFALRKKHRGVALVMAMFFMVLLSMLAIGYMRLVPTELRSATLEQRRSQGYFTANAVCQSVWCWLRYAEDTTGNPTTGLVSVATGNAAWPKQYRLDSAPNVANLPGFQPTVLNSNGTPDTTWSCETYLYPDAATDAGNSPHTFKLKTVAKQDGEVVYSAEFLLQQQTFAKYGFFVDNLPNGGFYTAFRDDRYDGEFHINGNMPLMVGATLFSNFAQPVFNGDVTFTRATNNVGGDNVAYQTGVTPFDGAGAEVIDPNGKGRYSELLSKGRSSLKLTADIPMPKTNTLTELPYAKAAWFGRNSSADSLASQTIPNGLNLNPNAGLYIKGDVRDLKLSVIDQLGNTVPRNASGLINSGNPIIDLREESNAAANQNLFTRVTELRDPSINFSIPAGARVKGQSNPLATPMAVAVNSTVVKRPPGTSQNPYTTDLYEVYSGFPNGVIYVDGNIGLVKNLNAEQANPANAANREMMTSTVNSAGSADGSLGGLVGLNYGSEKTIATNIATNKYVRLAGDLTRGDVALGQSPSGKRDGLGIVGYDVVVGGENAYASATPMYLYSLVMAGRRDINGATQSGSVVYENWTRSPGIRTLFSLGSYVVGNDRYWGDTTVGWMPSFLHDNILANSPPPFYPTRSDYKLMGYQEAQ